MNKKIVFAGCSFTAGSGWNPTSPICKDHEKLWVNLCYHNIEKFSKLELENVGIPGASNTDIFEAVSESLMRHDVDTVLIQWTAMPRYQFHVGLELWDTDECMIRNNPRQHDHILVDGIYSRKYVTRLLDELRIMHHLHFEIVKVLKYSFLIKKLCDRLSVKYFFINGICPWDNNYFVRLGNNVLPEDYTSFTKNNILKIHNRDDQDIFKIYKYIHDVYDQYPIDHSSWINLYQPFKDIMVDRNFDNEHPGEISNKNFFELVRKKIEQT
jgi:hypothetical protein